MLCCPVIPNRAELELFRETLAPLSDVIGTAAVRAFTAVLSAERLRDRMGDFQSWIFRGDINKPATQVSMEAATFAEHLRSTLQSCPEVQIAMTQLDSGEYGALNRRCNQGDLTAPSAEFEAYRDSIIAQHAALFAAEEGVAYDVALPWVACPNLVSFTLVCGGQFSAAMPLLALLHVLTSCPNLLEVTLQDTGGCYRARFDGKVLVASNEDAVVASLLDHLATACATSKLLRLTLKRIPLPERAMRVFARAPELGYVELDHVIFMQSGEESVVTGSGHFHGHPKLKELRLDYFLHNPRQFEGDFSKLAALLAVGQPECAPNLRELSLRLVSSADEPVSFVAVALAAALPGSTLECLDLSSTNIGSDGAVVLAAALATGGVTALRKLRCADCGIRSDGLSAILNASSHAPELDQLDLSRNDTSIGVDGFDILLDVAALIGAFPWKGIQLELRDLDFWQSGRTDGLFTLVAAIADLPASAITLPHLNFFACHDPNDPSFDPYWPFGRMDLVAYGRLLRAAVSRVWRADTPAAAAAAITLLDSLVPELCTSHRFPHRSTRDGFSGFPFNEQYRDALLTEFELLAGDILAMDAAFCDWLLEWPPSDDIARVYFRFRGHLHAYFLCRDGHPHEGDGWQGYSWQDPDESTPEQPALPLCCQGLWLWHPLVHAALRDVLTPATIDAIETAGFALAHHGLPPELVTVALQFVPLTFVHDSRTACEAFWRKYSLEPYRKR